MPRNIVPTVIYVPNSMGVVPRDRVNLFQRRSRKKHGAALWEKAGVRNYVRDWFIVLPTAAPVQYQFGDQCSCPERIKSAYTHL